MSYIYTLNARIREVPPPNHSETANCWDCKREEYSSTIKREAGLATTPPGGSSAWWSAVIAVGDSEMRPFLCAVVCAEAFKGQKMVHSQKSNSPWRSSYSYSELHTMPWAQSSCRQKLRNLLERKASRSLTSKPASTKLLATCAVLHFHYASKHGISQKLPKSFEALLTAFPLHVIPLHKTKIFYAYGTRQLPIYNWTLAHKCGLCIFNGTLNRQLLQRPSEGL